MGNNNSSINDRAIFLDFVGLSTVYPNYYYCASKYKSFIDFNYTCDNDKCNLETVINNVQNNIEIAALGYDNKTCIIKIIECINNNQKQFFANNVAGFIIKYNGDKNIFIKNTGVSIDSNTKFGLISGEDVHRYRYNILFSSKK